MSIIFLYNTQIIHYKIISIIYQEKNEFGSYKIIPTKIRAVFAIRLSWLVLGITRVYQDGLNYNS